MNTDITKIQEIFYELLVQEVMTRNVITVSPQTTMGELGDLLREHRISGAPVLEEDKLVGMEAQSNIPLFTELVDFLQACNDAGKIGKSIKGVADHGVGVSGKEL